MENIIIDGEFPYIVDLEAIFQVEGFQNSDFEIKSATDVLNVEIRRSILSTQLFPISSKFHDSNIDISGITGKGGQILENAKLKIINQFTDEMEVVREDGYLDDKNNIGKINGVLVDPKDYIKFIMNGFRDSYALIENNKKEILELINARELFYDIYPRYLFRNTDLYATILDMSKNPKYLKNISELDKLYHLLFNTSKNHYFNKIYQSELEDLFNDDIPYFYGNINENIIYNSMGNNCFELKRTPLEEVITKINCLNENDMNIQEDFIIKSMIKQKKTWNLIRELKDNNVICDVNNKKTLIEAAKEIGDILIDKSVIHEKTETINFLDIQNAFPTWTIKAQDISLYSGLSGTAIFFSSLHNETNDIKYLNILHKLLKTIRIDSDRINKKQISAFNGIISLAYLYVFLYKQTKDNDMLHKSLEIIRKYKDEIINNISYDIIDGLAGILIVVLAIYNLSKDKEIESLSIKIGKDIIDNIKIEQESAYWVKNGQKELMIAGFSHGISGLVYALSKLYKLTSFIDKISIIEDLINIENKYYDDKVGNWIDLREENTSNSNKMPLHWCHGATGIGLSRLRCKDMVDCSQDIDRALEIVIKKGLYFDSDCLCHGNFGNMELLLEAYRVKKDLNLQNIVVKRAKEIIKESKYRNEGYKNGVGQLFDSPGFMLGLSGIGYQMLRISNPIKYPSILMLEV